MATRKRTKAPSGKTPYDEYESQAAKDQERSLRVSKEEKASGDAGKEGKHTEGKREHDLEAQVKKARGKDDRAGLGLKQGKKTGLPTYSGSLTLHGVSAETGQEISIHIDVPTPVTEEGLFNRFRAYHPSAIRGKFKIDEKNVTDPLLRTTYG